jgi:hypothetical protein
MHINDLCKNALFFYKVQILDKIFMDKNFCEICREKNFDIFFKTINGSNIGI